MSLQSQQQKFYILYGFTIGIVLVTGYVVSNFLRELLT